MLRRIGGYVLIIFGILLIIAGIGISLIAARADIIVDQNAPVPGTSYPYAIPYGVPTLIVGMLLVVAGAVFLKYKPKKLENKIQTIP